MQRRCNDSHNHSAAVSLRATSTPQVCWECYFTHSFIAFMTISISILLLSLSPFTWQTQPQQDFSFLLSFFSFFLICIQTDWNFDPLMQRVFEIRLGVLTEIAINDQQIYDIFTFVINTWIRSSSDPGIKLFCLPKWIHLLLLLRGILIICHNPSLHVVLLCCCSDQLFWEELINQHVSPVQYIL